MPTARPRSAASWSRSARRRASPSRRSSRRRRFASATSTAWSAKTTPCCPTGSTPRVSSRPTRTIWASTGRPSSRQLKSRRKPRRERGINYNTEPESGFEEPLIAPTGLQGTREAPVSDLGRRDASRRRARSGRRDRGPVLRGTRRASLAPGGRQPSPSSPPRTRPSRTGEGRQQGEARAAEAGAAEEQRGGREQRCKQTAGEDAQQSAPPDTLQVLISVSRPSLVAPDPDRRDHRSTSRWPSPGSPETFEADRRLYIKGGDAGAVTVEINGQDAGTLGPPYTIGEKNFTLKNAS